MTHSHSPFDYAWLEAPAMRNHPESRLFYARWPNDAPTYLARTSVTELIQGIYEADPEMARKIVRSRIYTTQTELTETCRGMIRVAAKRATAHATAPDFSQAIQVKAPPAQSFELLGATPFTLDLLQPPPDETGPLYTRDRAVTALLTKDNRVLARARNTNAHNRTLHAELNLVRGWTESQGPLPEDATLYVSLQPCKMCAAQIAQAAKNLRRLSVLFAETDPGPCARATALEGIARKLS